MRIIETKAYAFNELTDEQKEAAIAKWYEVEDYPFLSQDIKEELSSSDSYFTDVKLSYSLNNCQGDGLSFSKGTFNLGKWLDDKTDLSKSKKWAVNEYVYKIYIDNTNYHYCYCSENDITFDNNYNDDGTEFPELCELFEDYILPKIKVYYINLCNKLEKYGYSILRYRMDYNEFEEHSEMNGYEFYTDGELV